MDKLRIALAALMLALLACFPREADAQQCGLLVNCPFASTPLDGTELYYIVQKGVSKKITSNQVLPNSGVTAGTFGDGTHVSSITVNSMGQVTNASSVSITSQGTLTSISQGNGIVATPNPITGTGTIAANIAGNNDIYAGTTNKLIDAAGAQSSIAPVALTISTATFTPAFGSGGGINEEITLVHASCPCTIANPTGVYAGLSGFLTIIQSSTGSDTVSWGGNWKFAGGTAPTLSTAANAIDVLPFYCRTTTFCAVTFVGNVH